jgi:UDP-glucose:glycoprotein glucosyltransferase
MLQNGAAAYSSSSSAPPVEVRLIAPWPAPPLLLEIFETVEREEKGTLFRLLDSFPATICAKQQSDEELLSKALKTFKEQGILSRPGQKASFLNSLALHAETPRIVAAWQLYNTSGLHRRLEQRTEGLNDTCDSWIDYGNKIFYSAADIESAILESDSSIPSKAARYLPGDHVKNTYDPKKTNAILYTNLQSDNFLSLHEALGKHAEKINYILRWKPTAETGVASLSGFGAYLDLKKVDYLVIDDRLLANVASKTDSANSKEQARMKLKGVEDRKWLESLLQSSDTSRQASLGSLTEEEIQPLGLRAAQAIMDSDNPIRAMKELAQNFPSHAVSLARDAQPPSLILKAEMERMQATVIEAGGEEVLLNGKSISANEFQPLGLLSIMREERALIDALTSLGMSSKESQTMLMSANISKAFSSASETTQPPTFDASDRIERNSIASAEGAAFGAITYWNDLEAKDDVRYAHWPSDLRSLLRPLYPGSFPVIRRNVFNVVVAMDPARLETIKLLSDNVQMAANKIGLRWGFVPLLSESSEERSVKMAGLIWLAVKQLDTTVTSKWLRRVAMLTKEGEMVDIDVAGRELDKFLYSTASEREAMLEEVDVTARLAMSRAWARRLRPDEGGSGGVFLNGQYLPYHAQLFQSLHQLIAMQLQTLVPMIYYGQIDEASTNISTFFYDLPDTYSARSELLFPPEGGRIQMKAIDLAKLDAALRSHIGNMNQGVVAIWIVGDRDSGNFNRLKLDLETIAQADSIPCQTIRAHDVGVDMPQDDIGLLINGKLIYGFDPHSISLAEYKAVIEQERRKAEIVQAFFESHSTEDIVVASSIVNAAFFVDSSKEGFFTSSSNTRSNLVDTFALPHMSFTVGDPQSAALRFSVLINPVGENVQKWSGVLSMLQGQPDVALRIILNPMMNLTDLPLRRFYRSSDATALEFDSAGNVADHSLVFYDMPKEAVLTMGLDAPPAWLTMPVEAIYDLDNIRLRDAITPTVRASYELRYILIEGHVRDMVSRTTPRGLELILETNDGSEKLDTIVMANLAYFQFRAKPGYYRLKIREGRSANLFQTESVGNAGWDSPPVEVTGDVIVLDTFHGSTLYPRVTKQKGKERHTLVEDESADQSSHLASDEDDSIAGTIGGAWKKVQLRLSSILPSARDENSVMQGGQTENADINVFTVASGHLYERMTYIMILSTLKHTNRSVKFWFIENFLSPSFKSFIPHLANEYGFTYELITYAWPHWLRPQTEKQRSIWGMKVLFLDVLFPLSLSNVIFVDADQIVRADLMELVQTDLKGAPYGFAPMGNDSYDMDNFRFWETGYWKQFLKGKPYPISALYVVDLKRFRLLAAGDKLRGHYQALSADPNSLSNLDQDLVASMIHNVPIFSLPREWLWCETWCSAEWYDKAKSIDLCSNPKTHEPKLDRARRQIPEWTPLDEEVGRLARRLEEQGRLQSNVVASGGGKMDAKDNKTEGRSHDEL